MEVDLAWLPLLSPKPVYAEDAGALDLKHIGALRALPNVLALAPHGVRGSHSLRPRVLAKADGDAYVDHVSLWPFRRPPPVRWVHEPGRTLDDVVEREKVAENDDQDQVLFPVDLGRLFKLGEGGGTV